MFDGIHTFFRIARGNLITGEHEDGIGTPGGTADPPPQLVEISQSEAVGPVNEDGIGIGDVDTAFDDGGGEEDVRLPVDEGMHDLFQVVPSHLSVPHQDPGFRNQLLQAFPDHLDALDAVVEEENLSFAFQLAAHTVPDHAFVIGTDRSVNRDAVGWRSVDGRHVAYAHERKVEGAGNRGGREGEKVDLAKAFLELLLVLHPEALFLVHDCQAEVLEGNVAGKEAVGADHDVDAAIGNALDGFSDFTRLTEATEEFNADGELAHAFPESTPVLFRQDGGGDQDRNLGSAGYRLEGCTNGHLGLAKADVTTDQAIHGLFRFHIGPGLGDGPDLVRGFGEGKGVFELPHPLGVSGMGMTSLRIAFCVGAQEARSVVHDRGLRRPADLAPAPVTQSTQERSLSSAPHVARNEVGLVDGDVQSAPVPVFDG